MEKVRVENEQESREKEELIESMMHELKQQQQMINSFKYIQEENTQKEREIDQLKMLIKQIQLESSMILKSSLDCVAGQQ